MIYISTNLYVIIKITVIFTQLYTLMVIKSATWMTETGTSFNATSNQTALHKPYYLKRSSGQFMARCFQYAIRVQIVQAKAAFEYPVSWARSENDVLRLILRYLVAKRCLAGLKDKAQSLNVKCQKCNDMRSNYRRCELEICVSFIQWLPKPSNQVQGTYRTPADDEPPPRGLQVRMWSKEYSTQNLVFSEKKILC